MCEERGPCWRRSVLLIVWHHHPAQTVLWIQAHLLCLFPMDLQRPTLAYVHTESIHWGKSTVRLKPEANMLICCLTAFPDDKKRTAVLSFSSQLACPSAASLAGSRIRQDMAEPLGALINLIYKKKSRPMVYSLKKKKISRTTTKKH